MWTKENDGRKGLLLYHQEVKTNEDLMKWRQWKSKVAVIRATRKDPCTFLSQEWTPTLTGSQENSRPQLERCPFLRCLLRSLKKNNQQDDRSDTSTGREVLLHMGLWGRGTHGHQEHRTLHLDSSHFPSAWGDLPSHDSFVTGWNAATLTWKLQQGNRTGMLKELVCAHLTLERQLVFPHKSSLQ